MAHFAELGENNIVLRVIVVQNQDIQDAEGNEMESIGVDFCRKLLGGTWKQTSYNGKTRKNYAGIGFYYDSELDAFIPPKPFNSWILNADTCQWESPVPHPNDGLAYAWDEGAAVWVQLPTDTLNV